MLSTWANQTRSRKELSSVLCVRSFYKMFCRLVLSSFNSTRIHWTQHSWLMDSINIMTSKPRRENMLMRSIIPIERNSKQQHCCKMKAHLFSSAMMFSSVCVAFFFVIPEDSAGLSSQDANDVLPSAGISHQSVYKPLFPFIIPPRQQWWTEAGGEVIRPSNLLPHVSCHLVLTSRLISRWGCLSIMLQCETA